MALAKLGRYNERLVALDGDTNNLTYSEIFKNEHPNRFVECYIAQQNMVRSSVGADSIVSLRDGSRAAAPLSLSGGRGGFKDAPM